MRFENGAHHCLIDVGEGRSDGILVDSEGAGCARYSAFVPDVEGLLTVGQYPALAELSRKLTEIVDFIAEQAGTGNGRGRGVIDLQSSELLFGIDLSKLQAILTSGMAEVGKGTAALINVCCSDNFDAFNMIDAHNAESLGRYYDAENYEKPEDISFEQYGNQCVKDEGGVFTEHGYIYFRYKELLPEYTGVVPDEHKIVGAAHQSLRSKQTERIGGEKPSVVEKIKTARQATASCQPGKAPPDKSKSKGRQEL